MIDASMVLLFDLTDHCCSALKRIQLDVGIVLLLDQTDHYLQQTRNDASTVLPLD
jgi:hypothetical protein